MRGSSERPARSRSRTAVFRTVALVSALFVAGAVAEVGLRVGGYDRAYFNPLQSFHEAHPLVGYRGKPGFVGRFRALEFDVVIAHDDRGFRRQEHRSVPEALSPPVFRRAREQGRASRWSYPVDGHWTRMTRAGRRGPGPVHSPGRPPRSGTSPDLTVGNGHTILRTRGVPTTQWPSGVKIRFPWQESASGLSGFDVEAGKLPSSTRTIKRGRSNVGLARAAKGGTETDGRKRSWLG